MSEHTYCDRCGMEITGERHCMGEGGTGPIFPWFHPKFDLCGGCFRDWENWLPRSVSTLDEKCDDREVAEAENAALREQVRALVEALFEVERGEEPPSHEWDDVLDMARAVLSLVTASDTLNSRNDNVRALVEAVKNAHIWRNETRSDTGPLEWPTAESWYEIKAASKAVQL